MLLLFVPAHAIESSVSPHQGSGNNIEVKYWDTNGTDTLRVYLLPCTIDDDGISYPSMVNDRKIVETEITGDSSIILDIDGDDGLYRICVKLKDSGRQDCDKDNYYLLEKGAIERIVEKEIIVEKEVYVERRLPLEEIEVDIISVPSAVLSDSSFFSVATIYNWGDPKNITVYSYMYNGSRCVTGGWKQNEMPLQLNSNLTEIELQNTVGQVDPGIYSFKVRVDFNGTKYDSSPFKIELQKSAAGSLSVSNFIYSDNNPNSSFSINLENLGVTNSTIDVVVYTNTGSFRQSINLAENQSGDVSITTPALTGEATIYVLSNNTVYFSETVLPTVQDVQEPGVIVFEESFLYVVLSCLTLVILVVLIWKR
jgi:hypothetical protein